MKSGRFGPYVTDGEYNATLRQGDDESTITARARGRAARRAARQGPGQEGGEEVPTKKTAKKTAKKTTKKARQEEGRQPIDRDR